MKVPRCLPALVVTVFISCLFAYGQEPAPAANAPTSAQSSQEIAKAPPSTEVTIPGPLRSFLRMAGISQEAKPEEVMSLLARNVFTQGYEGWQGGGARTEYLVLLMRYVKQARELAAMAGSDGVIRVSGCDDAGPLLHALGYRTRQGCGRRSTSLVTADPDRAFVTIDSGFPLSDLEETLQGGKPFAYPFPASRVSLQFTARDWLAASKDAGSDTDVVDVLLRDPVLSRLYWALTETDTETRSALLQSVGLGNLLPFASTLDFYGSQIRIRGGRVLVPGGEGADSAWKDLVGANPDSPKEFIPRLLGKDKGWLVAYYDALSRVNRVQQAHFTEARRLRRFYEALRGPDASPEAARTAFRPAPGLLLLLTRMQWDPSGEPHVPGNLEDWKEILRQRTESKIIREWGKRAGHWNHAEQMAEAMFAISRVETDLGPLQIYLALSELDSRRPPERRLSSQTVRALAKRFSEFSDQYLVFSEFPELNDASINLFLNVAENIDRIPNHTLRGNAMGVFQANLGLWQILARQGQIPSGALNDSWQAVGKAFAKVASQDQVFDAGCNSLADILQASTGKKSASEDEIIDLLAGPPQAMPEGQRTHQELADRMRSVLDGQRLVSLDTLLSLGEGLNELAQGRKEVGDTLIPLAGELREFEMPRPIFTSSERTQWAAGIYNNRHTEMEMRTDLTKVIKSPASQSRLEEARGQLAPLLRDTLVGLNYAYYEPPGAQMLHHNPLFVRSHDFAGETVIGVEHVWQAAQLFGEGSPAGGGAHLVGSLADLPYVLAEVEQDFIAPEHVQALIWKELVPGLLVSATVPRWWSVSHNELHAVTLYQGAGEELLKASTSNEGVRSQVVAILSDRMGPQRLEQVEQKLRAGQADKAILQMMPADTFYLAAEFRRKFPQEAAIAGPLSQELETLSGQDPAEVSWDRLSQDFGVPHPILAQTYARELLNVEPFPAFEGYSSRLLAESWDSSNLYWARLADEMGYSPVLLNRLAPELTHRMVEKIFATNFEDWPAILRAMRETGEELRQGKIALLPTGGTLAQQQ